MSPLMQFLARAYLPLLARHTLIDGAAHAARKAASQPLAGSGASVVRVAPRSPRVAQRHDDKPLSSLAA